MIYSVRRRNENNEKLMRRFKKAVQQQGVVPHGRKNRYFKKSKTKTRVRQEAIKRDFYRQKKMERILYA